MKPFTRFHVFPFLLVLLALSCAACSGKSIPLSSAVPTVTPTPVPTYLSKNGNTAGIWLGQTPGIAALESSSWVYGGDTNSALDNGDATFLDCSNTVSGGTGVKFYFAAVTYTVNASSAYTGGGIEFDIMMSGANSSTSSDITVVYGNSGGTQGTATIPITNFSTTSFTHENIPFTSFNKNASAAVNFLSLNVDSNLGFTSGTQFYLDNVIWY
jgi:hypothetical protein